MHCKFRHFAIMDSSGSSSSVRRPNFSQEETEILVREVQARSVRIYGTASRPPRADDAKVAWEEVTNIINQLGSGALRTVTQCKKRFNDVRRRAKQKLADHRRQSSGTGSPELGGGHCVLHPVLHQHLWIWWTGGRNG